MGCHSGKPTAPAAKKEHWPEQEQQQPVRQPPSLPQAAGHSNGSSGVTEGDPTKTLLLSRPQIPHALPGQAQCGTKFPPEQGCREVKISPFIHEALEEELHHHSDHRSDRDGDSEGERGVVRQQEAATFQSPSDLDSSSSSAMARARLEAGERSPQHLEREQLNVLFGSATQLPEQTVWELRQHQHEQHQGRGGAAHRGAAAARHVSFRTDSPALPEHALQVEAATLEAKPPSTPTTAESWGDNSAPGSYIRPSVAVERFSGATRFQPDRFPAAPPAPRLRRGNDEDTAIVPDDSAWSGVVGHFEYVAGRGSEALNQACCGGEKVNQAALWSSHLVDPFCFAPTLEPAQSTAGATEEAHPWWGGCCSIASPSRQQQQQHQQQQHDVAPHPRAPPQLLR